MDYTDNPLTRNTNNNAGDGAGASHPDPAAKPKANAMSTHFQSAKKWVASIPMGVKLVVGVAILAILVFIFVRWMAEIRKSRGRRNAPLVRRLVKEAARWGTLSAQDTNPLISLIHANYGLAYARVCRELMSESDIARMLHVDLSEMIFMLTEQQERSMQQCSQACPEIQPDDGGVAISTGWLA